MRVYVWKGVCVRRSRRWRSEEREGEWVSKIVYYYKVSVHEIHRF